MSEAESSEHWGKTGRDPKRQVDTVRSLAIKKGVLTHEVDEGSRCIQCGDACPGFSLHFWRKVCKNCLCPREEHDIRPPEDRQITVGKLLFSPDADTLLKDLDNGLQNKGRMGKLRKESAVLDADSPSILRKRENYTWTPKGVTLNTARSYFSDLPEKMRPIRETPGDRYWQKQKIRQLPAHDIDLLFCNDLTDEECKQMELFIKIRREKFLGKGEIVMRAPHDNTRSWKCEGCHLPIQADGPAVIAERVGLDKCWHPHCFACTDCKELLVELIYFAHKGQLFCGRHHSEKIKPRCAACDEIIFCREYTRAEEQDWHITHFCCLRCDTQLAGQNYMARDGTPYCLACYGQIYPINCETCKDTISVEEPRLSHEGKFWHSKASCFKCASCDKPLVDKPFLPKLSKIFCSRECMRSFKKQKRT